MLEHPLSEHPFEMTCCDRGLYSRHGGMIGAFLQREVALRDLTSTEHCQLGRAIGHSKAILTDFEEAGERLSSFCPPQTIRSAVQLEPDGDRHSETAQMQHASALESLYTAEMVY
jgi:hypothetical protein